MQADGLQRASWLCWLQCGAVPPQVGELACSGSEGDVLDCAYASGDDVFCTPEESVVVSCAGHGDAIGRPAPAPKMLV